MSWAVWSGLGRWRGAGGRRGAWEGEAWRRRTKRGDGECVVVVSVGGGTRGLLVACCMHSIVTDINGR